MGFLSSNFQNSMTKDIIATFWSIPAHMFAKLLVINLSVTIAGFTLFVVKANIKP